MIGDRKKGVKQLFKRSDKSMGNVISITAARNIKAIAQADREASLKYNSGAQNLAIGEFLIGRT